MLQSPKIDRWSGRAPRLRPSWTPLLAVCSLLASVIPPPSLASALVHAASTRQHVLEVAQLGHPSVASHNQPKSWTDNGRPLDSAELADGASSVTDYKSAPTENDDNDEKLDPREIDTGDVAGERESGRKAATGRVKRAGKGLTYDGFSAMRGKRVMQSEGFSAMRGRRTETEIAAEEDKRDAPFHSDGGQRGKRFPNEGASSAVRGRSALRASSPFSDGSFSAMRGRRVGGYAQPSEVSFGAVRGRRMDIDDQPLGGSFSAVRGRRISPSADTFSAMRGKKAGARGRSSPLAASAFTAMRGRRLQPGEGSFSPIRGRDLTPGGSSGAGGDVRGESGGGQERVCELAELRDGSAEEQA